ncbi:alpha/beta hydrolase [Rhodococcus tukisamuensis]|uniref:S-formylglutathione hydrolase FrmB n=1 Tax=Rhodococcus tukisamuensis TaxID=168276 RepID=A0A1G6V362_9NOCA|nr:alpha/beta hydrolase family protein [Rhodococcus tukisamuensis]SDD47417.1 S-formylglutathione hydrolase FrmB [Rhodococcus tukisamuensis]
MPVSSRVRPLTVLRRAGRAAVAPALVASVLGAVLVAPAQADPVPGGAARVLSQSQVNDVRTRLSVFSPSMDRPITVDLQRPVAASGVRPTLYLLDGAEAHEEESGWTAMTDVGNLARTANVNVVLPVGGAHSYYTDWRNVDPVMGRLSYETFLTQELPPLIDAQFGGNGVNAIAGASMGGAAALTLTARHPELYRGVAAYSDCAGISNPVNQLLVRWDVARGGGDVANMWGAFDDPAWAAHDPHLLSGNLRGKQIYLSSGNGLPGRYNNLLADPPMETVQGMFGEFGAMVCTAQLGAALSAQGIGHTTNLRPTGTHKWGYWNDELHASWPTLMGALTSR